MQRYFRAGRAIDGDGNVIRGPVIAVEGTAINAVGPAAGFGSALDDADVVDFGDATFLPGYIDSHAHPSLPGDGRSYEEVITAPDEVWALNATFNIERHLKGGVTTIRDNGTRNRIMFSVRDHLQRRAIRHSRLLLAGRPVVPTNGHMAWCNGAADSPDDIRRVIRTLAQEGADHIKLIASGGGTQGTSPGDTSYTVEKLRLAVDTAHELGLRTNAHCHGTSSIRVAAEAGVDCIEHASFTRAGPSQGARKSVGSAWTGMTVDYDPAVVELLARSSCILSLTLPGGYGRVLRLQEEASRRDLTEAEREQLAISEAHVGRKLQVLERLLADGFGDRIILGTDAGAGDTEFGRMWLSLMLAVRGGMAPMAAIGAATRVSAEALGIGDRTGSLEVGKDADLVVVAGDPLADITAAGRIVATIRGGTIQA